MEHQQQHISLSLLCVLCVVCCVAHAFQNIHTHTAYIDLSIDNRYVRCDVDKTSA